MQHSFPLDWGLYDGSDGAGIAKGNGICNIVTELVPSRSRLKGCDMSKIAEWARDWLDRADVRPSDRKIEDPLTILQRVFAALAAILAILSSPAMNAFLPNPDAGAIMIVRFAIALATLVAVNHVVTAKEVVETTAGFQSKTLRTYRYSTTERLIARGVIAVALLMMMLHLVPKPRSCNLRATASWTTPHGPATPLFVAVLAGGNELTRVSADNGRPFDLVIPPEHVSAFSLSIQWSDGTRSGFGPFAGCSAVTKTNSGDGRAQVDFMVR